MRRVWVVEVQSPASGWLPAAACLSWHEAEKREKTMRGQTTRIRAYVPLEVDFEVLHGAAELALEAA